MKRIVLTALFLISISSPAVAQVQVTLSSKHFGVEDEVHANVVNAGRNQITFCVEFGQWSPKNGELESTPSPLCSAALFRGEVVHPFYRSRRGKQ
jgi:hypothetical protein